MCGNERKKCICVHTIVVVGLIFLFDGVVVSIYSSSFVSLSMTRSSLTFEGFFSLAFLGSSNSIFSLYSSSRSPSMCTTLGFSTLGFVVALELHPSSTWLTSSTSYFGFCSSTHIRMIDSLCVVRMSSTSTTSVFSSISLLVLLVIRANWHGASNFGSFIVLTWKKITIILGWVLHNLCTQSQHVLSFAPFLKNLIFFLFLWFFPFITSIINSLTHPLFYVHQFLSLPIIFRHGVQCLIFLSHSIWTYVTSNNYLLHAITPNCLSTTYPSTYFFLDFSHFCTFFFLFLF
jgi:hypothetical protein